VSKSTVTEQGGKFRLDRVEAKQVRLLAGDELNGVASGEPQQEAQ